MQQTTHQLPTAGSHRARLLAEIERQPGQTKRGLRARLKLSTGPTERALEWLINAELVGIQRDERGQGRYVSLEQWHRGVDGSGARTEPKG